MINSMTGFTAGKGSFVNYSWGWELRSVNAKGRDLRLRVPDWIEGLEVALRAPLAAGVGRGNVNLTLRVQHDSESGTLAVNRAQLDSVLQAMAEVEVVAMDKGVSLAPANSSDVLALRGVLETVSVEQDTAPVRAAIVEDFAPVVADFLTMRAKEGAALFEVLSAQIDEIAGLTEKAGVAAAARKDAVADNLRAGLAKVLDNSEGADPQRVAQELAMIAVKADITEEIDRLLAHIDAARELLGPRDGVAGDPVGRKLDFLAQEFNREANTLCSKAQFSELTRIGLDLKAVIDQMREQVQNVE